MGTLLSPRFELLLASARAATDTILFDPKKHPRDFLGKFREVIGSLAVGQSVVTPGGTRVKRSTSTHFKVSSTDSFAKHTSKRGGFFEVPSVVKAATEGAYLELKSHHPLSAGGAKHYNIHNLHHGDVPGFVGTNPKDPKDLPIEEPPYFPWNKGTATPGERFAPLAAPATARQAWKEEPLAPILLRNDVGQIADALPVGGLHRLPEGTTIERLNKYRWRVDGPTGSHTNLTRFQMLVKSVQEEDTARANRFGNTIPGNPMGPLLGVDAAAGVGDQIGGMLHGSWIILPNGTQVHRDPGKSGAGDVFELISVKGEHSRVPATDKEATIAVAEKYEAEGGKARTMDAVATGSVRADGPLKPLPPDFVESRLALHRLSTQVIAPFEQPSNEVKLKSLPDGSFGTPMFRGPNGESTQMRVDGNRLIRQHGNQITSERIPGVSEEAGKALGDFYKLSTSVLEQLRSEYADEKPGETIIWPEHFDIAIELGAGPMNANGPAHRANFGASPGDVAHPDPYFYVGPWTPKDGPLWDAKGFRGAEIGYSDIANAADPRQALYDFYQARFKDILDG